MPLLILHPVLWQTTSAARQQCVTHVCFGISWGKSRSHVDGTAINWHPSSPMCPSLLNNQHPVSLVRIFHYSSQVCERYLSFDLVLSYCLLSSKIKAISFYATEFTTCIWAVAITSWLLPVWTHSKLRPTLQWNRSFHFLVWNPSNS